MSKRSRVPGPINLTTTGNEGQLVRSGIGKWRSLDPTSAGWTFNDPGNTDSLTNDTVIVGDVGIRVQMDKAKTAERFNSGTQTGPRFYKTLTGPLGVLTWADRFTLEILITRQAVGANDGTAGAGNDEWDGHGIVVGLADNSCEAAVSDVEWIGLGAYSNKGGGLYCHIGGDTGTNVVNNTTALTAYALWQPPIDGTDDDGDVTINKGVCLLMNTSYQERANGNSANQYHEMVAEEPIHLFFAPTFYTTDSNSNIDSDIDTTWKVWYRVNMLLSGFAPTYIPGEGFSD